MGWLRGMLENRTAMIDEAAGLPSKAHATPARKAKKKTTRKKKKDRRTKVSQFSPQEIMEMSDEEYLKLEQDI